MTLNARIIYLKVIKVNKNLSLITNKITNTIKKVTYR